ncbi:hypothetical protein JOF56_006971 [Kibdelosporangium banguiense]|uniref:NACHT domain-containing protein n=1 Tax=Kibdelosporangium banguiense TaxID=1365924 RepID=A0ABS4TQ93_9PSEU|nr:NACHT domain-containing protein [Kibdelosporangium banguiense]MBP2326586.1 hypothetical protein [Kibdelosporangium banguiense]
MSGNLLVLIAVGLLIVVVVLARTRPLRALEPSVEELCDELASSVRTQWRHEETTRRVHDPVPMPVTWRTESPESPVQDHWINVAGDGRVAPMELDGGIDHVHEIFERIPSRRMVVLGRSGAGKSVLATRLTLALLDRRTSGQRVPVLLSAATWDPRRHGLHEWIAHRLAADYPALRKRHGANGTVADHLVKNGHVLPVLDGLDEITPGLRTRAIRRCNAELHLGDPIVLTCRTEEYRALVSTDDVLTGAAVVELQPLGIEALAQYLPRTTRRVREAQGKASLWEPVIMALVGAKGSALREVLATPLMASLARLTYSETRAEPLDLLDQQRFPSADRLADHLLDELIPSMYPDLDDDSGGTHDGDVRRWATTLATVLSRRNARELAWWQLHHAMPKGISALVAAALGICTGLTVALIAGVQAALPSGIVVALFALLITLPQHTEPAVVRLRLRGSLRTLRLRFAMRPRAGNPLRSAGLIGWVVGGGAVVVALGVATGPVGLVCAIAGISFAVLLDIWFDVPSDISRAPDPWTVLREDRTSALSRGLARGVVVAVAAAPAIGVVSAFALLATVVAGSFAHTAWGKFLVARSYFAVTGQLPWRLAAFLVESHERGILRQVGPVYEFRHARLQTRLLATAG